MYCFREAFHLCISDVAHSKSFSTHLSHAWNNGRLHWVEHKHSRGPSSAVPAGAVAVVKKESKTSTSTEIGIYLQTRARTPPLYRGIHYRGHFANRFESAALVRPLSRTPSAPMYILVVGHSGLILMQWLFPVTVQSNCIKKLSSLKRWPGPPVDWPGDISPRKISCWVFRTKLNFPTPSSE